MQLGRRTSPPHSPSAWSERVPLAALAVIGLALSCYLAAYQLGAVAAPWDPIFGAASSARVLHSALSRALPVPDAAIGAAAYLAEIVAALAGGRDRWRTHPWIVLVYGAVAAGLGLVGAGLVVMQALVLRAGCALCLCSAATSIAIALGVAMGGEVYAAARALTRPVRSERWQ